MGIDRTAIESILLSLKHVPRKTNMLTLGRQQVHIPQAVVAQFLYKYGLVDAVVPDYQEYCEDFFQSLGFQTVDSIDNSEYERATILHNMNLPVPETLKNAYDYIYDGGTTEHVFNAPQALQNVIDMLRVGGVVCSVVPNNNQSGHGFYQFSPEMFLAAFSPPYGMRVREMYIAVNGSDRFTWKSVASVKDHQFGRNQSRFNTTDEVFLITVAEKIAESDVSLLQRAPNQYSYEEMDWKGC